VELDLETILMVELGLQTLAAAVVAAALLQE
jgi:hypothetical protein